MICVVNYADKNFNDARRLNTKTAYRHGADRVFEFYPTDIDNEFYKKNKYILNQKRGNGCWLWKPYFVNKVLNGCEDGDWVIYSDAGLYFRRNIHKFINEAEKEGTDLITQNTKFLERQYTKRIVFIKLGMDLPEYTDSIQRNGIIAVKKTAENVRLVGEWLLYCQDPDIMTESEAEKDYPNYPDFVAGREDQSVLSLLCKKYSKPAGILFADIVKPFKGKALMTYHHTRRSHIITAWYDAIRKFR